jgi:hypothetical protein
MTEVMTEDMTEVMTEAFHGFFHLRFTLEIVCLCRIIFPPTNLQVCANVRPQKMLAPLPTPS